LLQDPTPSFKILNATVNMSPDDEDPLLEHQRRHISSAQFLDLNLCRDLTSPYPNMMPNAAHFTATMKALDVRLTDAVIVYDCRKGFFASRAAFVLRAYGIKNVKILDGGLNKWAAEGKPVAQSERPLASADDFAFVKNEDMLASFE